MSTTIRISKNDKLKLDNLIRFISFQSNRKISQEEFLAHLILIGEQEKEALAEKFAEKVSVQLDFSDDPFFNLPKLKLGTNASGSVDQTLYGER